MSNHKELYPKAKETYGMEDIKKEMNHLKSIHKVNEQLGSWFYVQRNPESWTVSLLIHTLLHSHSAEQ